MAIKKDFKHFINDSAEYIIEKDAYWKIGNISGRKENILANVEIKKNAVSESIGLFVIAFTPEMTTKNYHQQAYEYLKTLPDFANCVDC